MFPGKSQAFAMTKHAVYIWCAAVARRIR